MNTPTYEPSFPTPESDRWVMSFVLRACDGGCKRTLRYRPSTECIMRLHCSRCKHSTNWVIVA